jgi:hypothetical protein
MARKVINITCIPRAHGATERKKPAQIARTPSLQYISQSILHLLRNSFSRPFESAAFAAGFSSIGTSCADQIWFGQTAGSGDSPEAEPRRFRYPLGEKVTVSYDPAIAAVHPGFQADALWLPGAGLAFLVSGLMAFLMYKSAFTGSGMAVGLGIFTLVFMTVGGPKRFGGTLRPGNSDSHPAQRTCTL